eukprot:tig00001086_g6865.t1
MSSPAASGAREHNDARPPKSADGHAHHVHDHKACEHDHHDHDHHDHSHDHHSHSHGHEHEGTDAFIRYMAAGAFAGTIEQVSMHPLDLIKTRMQALSAGGPASRVGMLQTLRGILHAEGGAGLFRGVLAAAAGNGPSHSLFYAVYEVAKEVLDKSGHSAWAEAAAGGVATIAQDVMTVPLDVIKQRQQLATGAHRSIASVLAEVRVSQGYRSLWSSLPITLVMNVPYSAVYFATFEQARRALSEAGAAGMPLDLASGFVSGALAGALTNPLDVIKTRIQTQGFHIAHAHGHGHAHDHHHHHEHGHAHAHGHEHHAGCRLHAHFGEGVRYKGARDTLARILAEEGPRALAAGLRERVALHAPSAAICWASYEGMKRLLGMGRDDGHKCAKH